MMNIRRDSDKIYTRSLRPGTKVYGERLVQTDDGEYREWSYRRSKLAAYIMLGGEHVPISPGSNVLYLGAASGTTASHVSDIVDSGMVYCVEYSQRSFRDLVKVCDVRKNMIPLLGDASLPDTYGFAVGDVDVVYQDVAQKRQAEMFISNMERFSADHGMLCIKARSEDVTLPPAAVFKAVRRELEDSGLNVLDMMTLDPYEKDHAMAVVGR